MHCRIIIECSDPLAEAYAALLAKTSADVRVILQEVDDNFNPVKETILYCGEQFSSERHRTLASQQQEAKDEALRAEHEELVELRRSINREFRRRGLV